MPYLSTTLEKETEEIQLPVVGCYFPTSRPADCAMPDPKCVKRVGGLCPWIEAPGRRGCVHAGGAGL